MEQSSSKSIEKAIKPDTTDKKQDETLPKPPEKALAKTIEPLKGPTNSTALGNDSESTTQTTMEPKLWIDNKGDKEAEKPKLKISDKDGPLENATDEIVFAEDPGYKEYNLTLHTPETGEISISPPTKYCRLHPNFGSLKSKSIKSCDGEHQIFLKTIFFLFFENIVLFSSRNEFRILVCCNIIDSSRTSCDILIHSNSTGCLCTSQWSYTC
jgi:hypothetical protein